MAAIIPTAWPSLANRRSVACDGNARLLVLDAPSGAIRNRFTVGDHPDVLAYDPGLGRLYVMAESGVVAVLEVHNGSVSLLARRKLAAKAHSVAVDLQTHAVYVPLEAAGARPILRLLLPAWIATAGQTRRVMRRRRVGPGDPTPGARRMGCCDWAVS